MTVATFVDLYHTVTGKTIVVFTTNGKRRSLNCESWANGEPALVEVTKRRFDTALVRASRRRRQIGPKTVRPELTLTLANGRTLKELVVHDEHFVDFSGNGLIAIKHDNPDARLNVVVFGQDANGPWATCSAPCSHSGYVADYRLVGDSITVTPSGRPVSKIHPKWVLDFTGNQLMGSQTAPAASDFISASA